MAYEYYEYLRIERTATDEEIKRAYRKRAMESHPDRHQGDKAKEEEFKKINEAYSVLSDSEKRAHYDRFGSADSMGGFGGFSGGFSGMGGFEDIFDTFFNGGGGRRANQRRVGEDIEVMMRISLADAILGTTRTIEYSREILCSHCSGSGAEDADSLTECDVCHGTGQVREQSRTIFGVIEQTGPCQKCHGKGKIVTNPCHVCHGKGLITEKVKKDVAVPAGIESGMSIKLRGEGNQNIDGNGDLYIHFEVPDQEASLIREGMDLHTVVKVTPAEAVLGIEKTIDLPILGRKTITIHHGSSHGTIIRNKKEGIPSVSRKDQKGDLLFHIEIEVPKKLSVEEREHYEALLILSGGKKGDKGFFEKIFE